MTSDDRAAAVDPVTTPEAVTARDAARPTPALRVDADVRFAVADGARSASGTVAAAGSTVTVTVDRPWAALRALRSAELPGGFAGGRSDLAPVADAVQAAGLRLAVVGPNGPLLTLGEGVHSRLGRLATGSPLIAVRPRALVSVRGGAYGLGALALAGLSVVLLAGRRRGSGN